MTSPTTTGSTPPLLEVAANSLASALAAHAGGASRIELCTALELGGLTPSYGEIALVRERLAQHSLDLPVYVLIRPRAGNFINSELELETMRRDITTCGQLGCNGVVIGVLDVDRRVAIDQCRSLVDVARAHGMGVTFHRAFDLVRDQAEALEDVVSLGIERILTSGGRPTALDGAAAIRSLVEKAAGRVRIMAGAGLTADNVRQVARETGANELHASAKRVLPSGVRWTNDDDDAWDAQGMSEGEVRKRHRGDSPNGGGIERLKYTLYPCPHDN